MEYVLALAIIGLFCLELTHREKTNQLARALNLLTGRVGVLEDAASPVPDRPLPRRRSAASHAQVPAVPAVARSSGDAPAAAVTAAAGAPAVTMGLDRHGPRRPSPIAAWFERMRASEEWEALIGGRLMNRIGAIALILGIGFFLKYAIDQNWIGQTARVGIGLALGLGLLALALRSHRRGYAVFAQGLVGAGQAVLYLSVYASYNFYHLVPQPVALAGMGIVTALGFVQAMYYDSLTVSLLAALGGYLAPFLLSSSGSGPSGTIAYLALLNAGVLFVTARKPRWFVLEPAAMLGSYAAWWSWYAAHFTTGQTVLALIALSLFWAQFLAYEVWSLVTGAEGPVELWHALGAINALVYLAGMVAVLASSSTLVLGGLVLGLSATYAGVLLAVKHSGRLSPDMETRYGLSAVILLTLGTAIHLRGFPVVVLWTLEAVPLVWAGVIWGRKYLWQPALAMLALALGLLFVTADAIAYAPIGDFRPVLNLRDLTYLALIGGFAASGLAVRRLPKQAGEAVWQTLQYAWTGLSLIWLAVETVDLFHRFALGATETARLALVFDRWLAVAAVWMTFSLVLGAFAWRRRVIPWLVVSLGSAGLAAAGTMAAGFAFQPVGSFVPVLNVRFLAFALIAGGLALHRHYLAHPAEGESWRRGLGIAVQSAILAMGFELIFSEVNDFFLRHEGNTLVTASAGAAFKELAILAALWAMYSLLPSWLGLRQREPALVVLGLSMTAAATGVAAVAGIAIQPSDDLGLALAVRPLILVVLVGALLAQMRLVRAGPIAGPWRGHVLVGMQAAIILLGFGLVSAETRDAFARIIAGAAAGQIDTLQNLERLAYSLVWLAYAIGVMGLGIWRRARWMRLGAMALFAGVILKVFVYDLSFLGAVYRPASFAGLGVVLLLVSFLYSKYRRVLFETR